MISVFLSFKVEMNYKLLPNSISWSLNTVNNLISFLLLYPRPSRCSISLTSLLLVFSPCSAYNVSILSLNVSISSFLSFAFVWCWTREGDVNHFGSWESKEISHHRGVSRNWSHVVRCKRVKSSYLSFLKKRD